MEKKTPLFAKNGKTNIKYYGDQEQQRAKTNTTKPLSRIDKYK